MQSELIEFFEKNPKPISTKEIVLIFKNTNSRNVLKGLRLLYKHKTLFAFYKGEVLYYCRPTINTDSVKNRILSLVSKGEYSRASFLIEYLNTNANVKWLISKKLENENSISLLKCENELIAALLTEK